MKRRNTYDIIFYYRVKQLLKEDAGAGRRADDAGVTPLHWAAINDRPEIVDLLLDSGADPNSKGDKLQISADIFLLKVESLEEPRCIGQPPEEQPEWR